MNPKQNNAENSGTAESSGVQVPHIEVTTDTETYMKKSGWEPMSRIDVRAMWRVAVDVIEEMQMHKDCAFTWSADRKAIIVWRNDR